MSKEYDDFLVQQNIDRFSRLLESEQNPKKRATLSQLLAEERAKMVGLLRPNDATIPGCRASPDAAGEDEFITVQARSKAL